MHTKLRHFIKKAAVTLALGIVVMTGISITKPQTVQAADHIYKNKTFYIYAEHAVKIQSYFSDDKISQSSLPNWNGRGYGTINIYSEGSGFSYNGKSCYRYKVEMVNVDVKNKTPYIYIRASGNANEGYYPVSARITNYNNDNGCNVKANEYKQLTETLDASNRLFAYIGYSFTGTEMEVKFDRYQFDVSYDLNGGIGDSSSQSGYFSSTQTGVKLHSAPSKTGYTFNNWICNRDGKPHAAGSNYYPNNWSTGHLRNQITMTADYTAKPYYVSYDPNKPSNASSEVKGSMPSKVEFRYDKAQNLSDNNYTLTGWTFAGWNTKADGTGKSYTNGQQVTNINKGNDVTLYAQWVANVYRVNFDKVAGENGTSFMYEKYDTGFYSDENCKNKITKITVPSRVNYTFNGYFEENERIGKTITDASGNIKCGTNFFPNKININDGNHYDDTTSTVYAYWIPATYKITLNDNGGSGGSGAIYEWFDRGFYSNKNHTQGTAQVKIPTRTGYKFGGYWTSSNEPLLESSYSYLVSGVQRIGSDGFLKTDPDTSGNRTDLSNTEFSRNTTLYALWIPLEFKITLSSTDADITHGTPEYTEVYGYYNYTEVPKVYTNGETQTDTASSGFSGKWETFTAPYTGEYTFKDGDGNSKTVTLKRGETIKIYNSTN